MVVLVDSVTRELERMCRRHEDVEAKPPNDATKVFYGAFRQPFPLRHYIQRLVDHTSCSLSAYTAALIYLRRAQSLHSHLRVTEYSVHRLFSTALLLATKYLDDKIYGNVYYARVGGVEIEEMNSLEIEFLKVLRFDVSLDYDGFFAAEQGVLKACPLSDVSDSTDSEVG